jgi:hypothetical protein
MLVEVDDGALSQMQNELNQARNHKSFIERCAQDPRLRPQLLQLIKTMNPNVSIPEFDVVSAAEKRVEASILQKLNNAGVQQRLQQEIEVGRKLLKDHGYSDDDVAKIEGIMLAEGVSSHETAENIFWARNRGKGNQNDKPFFWQRDDDGDSFVKGLMSAGAEGNTAKIQRLASEHARELRSRGLIGEGGVHPFGA